ncbi:MAG: hypothetical protein GX660_16350 [Clostridiaceae bacterium]|nr:hypothetical protein [Clostridiaceae bacterium]
MKSLSSNIQKNIMLISEILVYLLLLGTNLFFAHKIYISVINRPDLVDKAQEITINPINTINENLLNLFVEDQADRVSYEGVGLSQYENIWNDLENPISPF